MKVQVDPSLQSLSGRWSRKDNSAIALNKHTGKMYQYQINPDAKHPNSAAQQTIKSVFTDKIRAASAWWNDNKPTESNPDGTALYQELMRHYLTQYKYGNPFNYCRSLITADLKIVIGGITYDIDLPDGGDPQGPGSGTGGGGDDDPDGGGALS